MGKFIKNIIIALLPVAIINVLCFGLLFYFAAHEDLTYVNYASSIDKERRLSELSGHPRLVLIGGSNARFGFGSGILEDSLHIAPVNMAIHIGLGLNYMFEEVDTALRAGDVLFVSAEYSHFLDGGPFYGDEGLSDMYLVKHQWLNALSHIVDTHNINSVYRLIRRRVKRLGMTADVIPTAMEVRTKYNVYGDYIGHYGLSSDGSWDKSPTVGRLADDKIFDTIKNRVASLKKRGVEVVFLPPPYCQTAYNEDSILINDISRRLSGIGMPFMFDPSLSVYPDSMFYDSRYHLTREGGIVHSGRVAHNYLLH